MNRLDHLFMETFVGISKQSGGRVRFGGMLLDGVVLLSQERSLT